MSVSIGGGGGGGIPEAYIHVHTHVILTFCDKMQTQFFPKHKFHFLHMKMNHLKQSLL